MGISIWQLLIVLGIVILLFGTKKLRNIGTDLGGAIRGFKKSIGDEDTTKDKDKDDADADANIESKSDTQVYEATAEKTEDKPRT